jgi:hypothetical protein
VPKRYERWLASTAEAVSFCHRVSNQPTHIINMASKVQENGICEFGPIDEIVLSKAVAVQHGSVDVHDHISVVGP